MTITNDLRMPVPLRVFLEADLDPASVGCDVWQSFQDTMRDLVARTEDLDYADVYRPHAAEHLRHSAVEMIEGRAPSREAVEQNWGGLQRYVNHLAWTADLLEDPALVDLLVKFLTPEQRERLAYMVAAVRSPHPLVVGRTESGTCNGCGVNTKDTVAMSVGHVEGWSEPPDEGGGPWCFSCVTMAYEALKAAQG